MQMPSSLEHLRTFSERPPYEQCIASQSIEGIFAQNAQKDRECEWVQRCESAVRAQQRGVLFIRMQ